MKGSYMYRKASDEVELQVDSITLVYRPLLLLSGLQLLVRPLALMSTRTLRGRLLCEVACAVLGVY
jgi:hypothetical protein